MMRFLRTLLGASKRERAWAEELDRHTERQAIGLMAVQTRVKAVEAAARKLEREAGRMLTDKLRRDADR